MNKTFLRVVLILLLTVVGVSYYSGISPSFAQQKPTSSQVLSLPGGNSDKEDISISSYEDSFASLNSPFSSSPVRVIFSLLAVLGLIYFFLFFLRKFSRTTRYSSSGNEDVFSIVGRLSLSAKKNIYLIRTGEKILVLGVDEQIRLLSIIEDKTVMESLRSQLSPSSPGSKFSDYLKNFISFSFSSRSREKSRINWKHNND